MIRMSSINHNINLSKIDKSKGLKLPDKHTSELAYLVGIFAGDGSLSYRKEKKEYSLKCVGNPKDEKELYQQIICPLIKKLFGISIDTRLYDKDTTYGIRIFSKSLVLYLNQIGLPIGSKYDKLRIPKSFIKNKALLISFIRGVFDTDGSIAFKKRYRKIPYYPVISFSSKSDKFVKEIADILRKERFRVVELYNYKMKDKRVANGYTLISRIELNGRDNLLIWQKKIGFYSPKHLDKIERYFK